MSLPLAKRSLVIGLAVSLCAHLICAALLYRLDPDSGGAAGADTIVLDFDINEAPEAPSADMPVDDPEAPMEDPEADDPAEDPAEDPTGDQATDPAEDDVIPIPPPPEDIEDPIAVAALDAGVPDASALADNSQWDAGTDEVDPDDAGPEMIATAPTLDAGLDELAQGGARDAGVAELADAGATEVASADLELIREPELPDELDDPRDAGANPLPGPTSSDQLAIGLAPTSGLLAPVSPSPGGAAAGQPSGDLVGPDGASPTRTPSQANLLAYMPQGELITVLIRFDRLRGTEWSERTAAVLAPMPDSRALLGNRKVAIADLFSTLVVSSPSPRDVTATTVIGRSDMSNRKIRTFLDHPRARVTWTAARGGALGKRRPSRLVAPHDERLFLLPYPGWVVLTRPRNLGALVQPGTGDLDQLTAAPADLPPWLASVRSIELESGQDTGPAVVVTIARMLPDTWKAPYLGDVIGEIATPDQATLALEVTEKGFFVRGTLIFASIAAASDFVAKAEEAQKNFVDTMTGRALLSQVKAYNAVRGLSFARNKEKVGYATSISVADARAVMDFAAMQTRNFFLSGYSGPPPAPPKSSTKSPARKSPKKQ